ncbi:MAG: cysteine methyltransferase [Phycisphaerae bacterium]|nr:cysteine methyltransferase [Phycisphaerae bacterium]
MLEHGGSSEWRARHFGPTDETLLPSLCDRILRSMAGEQVNFDDIDLPRGTAFQRAIWRETRRIRLGLVRTYGDLAAAVGRPTAARAVGQAMRRNPQPIVTPCHRVVSASGPGGFGGHGADGRWSKIKATLLEAEAVDTRI